MSASLSNNGVGIHKVADHLNYEFEYSQTGAIIKKVHSTHQRVMVTVLLSAQAGTEAQWRTFIEGPISYDSGTWYVDGGLDIQYLNDKNDAGNNAEKLLSFVMTKSA